MRNLASAPLVETRRLEHVAGGINVRGDQEENLRARNDSNNRKGMEAILRSCNQEDTGAWEKFSHANRTDQEEGVMTDVVIKRAAALHAEKAEEMHTQAEGMRTSEARINIEDVQQGPEGNRQTV